MVAENEVLQCFVKNGGGDTPIAFVDLNSIDAFSQYDRIPMAPFVGIGQSDTETSAILDTIVDSAISAQVILNAVAAQPHASAILIHLLRMLPKLSLEDGLMAESLAYATLQSSEAHRNWMDDHATGAPKLPSGTLDLVRSGNEITATLNRPEAGNAIDRSMRDDLYDAFSLVNIDTTISRITLNAKGKAFSLGADLSEFGTTRDAALAHSIRTQTLPAREAIHCADRFFVEVDGACIGAGLELAAFACHISATRRSWFQLPELAMGILPGAGGCVSLTHRIGRQRTAWMILSGKRVSAQKALEWGLIDAIID